MSERQTEAIGRIWEYRGLVSLGVLLLAGYAWAAQKPLIEVLPL